MDQKPNKEKNGATITELVAKTEQQGSRFFRSEDDRGAVQLGTDDGGAQRVAIKQPGCVFIEEVLRNNNMLVKGSVLSPVFADEYRRIKRPLLSNAFGKSASLHERGNLILVTSSIPGEGKTYTAINLALSMAYEQDYTVLLIDCDVTRCGTSRMLGVDDKPGLVDVLENSNNTVGDVILRTDIPKLSLISAGSQHEFVTEMLASQRMSELMAEIGKRYNDRVIIFDGPPLLPTPQTQVLSGLVGQVVFVIEAGKTPQAVVAEALNMISEDKATGPVINNTEGVSARSSYYYGYYDDNRKTDGK